MKGCSSAMQFIAAQDNFNESRVLTGEDLLAVKFIFSSSFQVNLADGDSLFVKQVVRFAPNQRLIAFGTWQGKPVAAKLFFHPKHAKRYMEQEKAGIKLLQENQISTPALYYQGMSQDGKVYVLLFEKIANAKTLDEIWRNRTSVGSVLPLLQSVITEVAGQHILGALQQDINLKNFLLTENTIYTLDGTQIKNSHGPVSKDASMNNLAWFFLFLGVEIEDYQGELFRHYAKTRGWLIKNEDILELSRLIKNHVKLYWKRMERKIFEESSDFSLIQAGRMVGMFDRSYASLALINFLRDPDSAFNHPTAELLKPGQAADTAKITLDNRIFIIKRYQAKKLWQRFTVSRASILWRLAHKLSFFGIRIAKPVAYIEKKLLKISNKSYYVTEYVSDEHADAFFIRHGTQKEKISGMVNRISTLLKNVNKLKIKYSDLQMTDILVDHLGLPVIVDLDNMIES